MSLKNQARSILLRNPKPGKISRGALITYLQAAVTPASRFSTRSEKKLSLVGYRHAMKFFRERGEGGKQVFTSLFAPIELVYALDLLPFPLEAMSGAAASFDIADRLLQKTDEEWHSADICSFHRTFIGISRFGLLPSPRFLLATSHCCDGTMKSFSEVAGYFSKPLFFIHTPQRSDRGGVSYLADQIRTCAEDAASLTNKRFSMQKLETAFEYSNRARRALVEIEELRKNHPPLIWGSDGFGFVLAWATFLGSRGGAGVFERYMNELKRKKEKAYGKPAKKRVLWLHLKPYFSNTIIDWMEKELGAVIVFEDINSVRWEDLDIGRPWESLARKLLSHPWVGPIENRLKNIKRIIEEYRIDGVINFTHWGCRQSNAAERLIRDAVSESGIPLLTIDGDLVDSRNYSEGQFKTRIEAFMELMEGC